ncbi:hypothetical protein J437_LFUL000018 [Ladona fulva]|uniref:Uncharacterized protein n=1 Tax=Ladona fulva TaxID=123851 RepID=A0A8K0JYI9_LADFU|nr:hypothetical protein J437_LFUL000018 [Ladona fulva]
MRSEMVGDAIKVRKMPIKKIFDFKGIALHPKTVLPKEFMYPPNYGFEIYGNAINLAIKFIALLVFIVLAIVVTEIVNIFGWDRQDISLRSLSKHFYEMCNEMFDEDFKEDPNNPYPLPSSLSVDLRNNFFKISNYIKKKSSEIEMVVKTFREDMKGIKFQ